MMSLPRPHSARWSTISSRHTSITCLPAPARPRRRAPTAAARAAPQEQRGEASSSSSAGAGAQQQQQETISLDTGGQVEQLVVTVPAGARLVRADLRFPLGVVFEAAAGGAQSVVAEVAPGGAADAAGVRAGDVLCALSAAAMRMTFPAAQLMLGGVGRPKLMRALVPAAGGFAKAMDFLRSNKRLGDEVTLFLWRPPPSGGGGGSGDDGGGSASGSRGAEQRGSAASQGSSTAAAPAAAPAAPAAPPGTVDDEAAATRQGGGAGDSGSVFDSSLFDE